MLSKHLIKGAILFLLAILFVAELPAIEPHFMENPAISPDGKQVCFSYLGDLWLVSFYGGEAKQLTVTNGNENYPAFSPDGEKIAFNSNMDGAEAIYTIPAKGGEAKMISEEPWRVRDWFVDKCIFGKKQNGDILATSYKRGLGTNYFVVPADGEERPHMLTEIGGFFCDLSQNSKKIIYQENGYQTRERYRGSHNGELWEYDIENDSYKQLTDTDFTEAYPVYSSDGKSVYFAAADFVKSNEAVFQIYKVTNNDFSNRQKITDFKDWSARHLSIALDNDRIVFEKFDEIWKYDPESNKVSKLDIQINKDILPDFEIKEEPVNVADDYSVSPDGKFIVFSYKYDLFAVPTKGGEVKQITNDHAGISDIVVMPDNKTTYYTKFESGLPILYKTFIDNLEEQVKIKKIADKVVEDITLSDKKESKLLVRYSDNDFRYKLAAIDEDREVEKLITDKHMRDFKFSSDEKYAFFITLKENHWDTVLWLKNFETDETEMILPLDGYMTDILWGEYGNFAFLVKNGMINRIFLKPKDDFWLEEDYWEEILYPEEEEEEQKDKAEEEIKEDEKDKKEEEDEEIFVETKLIRKRFEEITAEDGWNQLITVAPDSTLYYLNLNDDKYSLYSMKYDGSENEEFYSFPGRIENITYHKKEDCFYFLEHNTIKKLSSSKTVNDIEYDFKYTYDEMDLNKKVFKQIWRIFGWGFYDPDMHGLNWDKIYKKYAPYVKYAYTPKILDKIATEMIGDVNASHTGFYPRRTDDGIDEEAIAYIGAEFDHEDVPDKGIKIGKVYNRSKLNEPHNIQKGDVLLAVDGREIIKETDIDPLFRGKVDEKIELKIKSQADDSIKTIEVKGLNSWQQRNMYYDNWVDERRAKVEAMNDDIGYMHIRHMGWSSYEKFRQDLLAHNYNKDAVILDVRNNPGGYIHDYLIELLTKEPYAFTTNRIFNAKKKNYPLDVWQKPIVLLINKNSFSDAEIFPILFQQFEFGKVIGTPTSGSVIGTGHYRFMDGSSMRMPGTGWYTIEGINMEGTGAKPDIYLEMTPKQKIADNDVQLKRAVEELEKELSK